MSSMRQAVAYLFIHFKIFNAIDSTLLFFFRCWFILIQVLEYEHAVGDHMNPPPCAALRAHRIQLRMTHVYFDIKLRRHLHELFKSEILELEKHLDGFRIKMPLISASPSRRPLSSGVILNTVTNQLNPLVA